jgi:hypothetical protein
MAKKRQSRSILEGPRLLSMEMSSSTITTDPSGDVVTSTGDGWELLSNDALVNRKYFDLSGYVVEDLTLFAQSIVIQEGHPPFGTPSPPVAPATTGVLRAVIIDLITTEFVSNAEIVAVLATNTSLFGFSRSTLDFNQILYGRHRQYNISSTISPSIPNLHSLNMFGIGSSTAASKLYITRIVLNQEAASTFQTPESNWVVGAMIVREKELPYIQRTILSNEHTPVN